MQVLWCVLFLSPFHSQRRQLREAFGTPLGNRFPCFEQPQGPLHKLRARNPLDRSVRPRPPLSSALSLPALCASTRGLRAGRMNALTPPSRPSPACLQT